MKVTSVLVLLMAALVVGVARAEDVGTEGDQAIDSSLEELDQLDEGLFSADPLPAAVPPPPAVEENEAALEADAEAPLAASAAEREGERVDAGVRDSEAAYSFRAMEAATDVAGSGLISEKAAETHRMAQKFLQDNAVSADDMFAEINREQQILAAKRALVARQKESIAESEKSLKRLFQLVTENKGILKKNEAALRGSSDDLLKLIAKYQAKLKAGLTPAPKPKKKKAPKKVVAKKTKKTPKKVKKSTKSTKTKKAKKVKATKTKKQPTGKKSTKTRKLAKKAGKAAAAKNMHFASLDDDADSDSDSDDESDTDDEESDENDTEDEQTDEDSDENDSDDESESEDELDEESLLEVRAGLLDNDNIDIMDRTTEHFEDEDEDVDMHAGNLLPGLGAPPKLYKPEEEDLAI